MNDRQCSSFVLAGFVLGILYTEQLSAAPSIYTDRAKFESNFEVTIVDDYESPRYVDGGAFPVEILSDAEMNGVLNETRYTATGFPNTNFIVEWNSNTGDHLYCAGCTGSFLLDFTQTSISYGGGVDGFGVDFVDYGYDFSHLEIEDFSYYAYVTFGDGTAANYKLATTPEGYQNQKFFGIVSVLQIASVHFGWIDGEPWQGGQFAIDNLTIGRVPEPTAMSLSFAGLLVAASLTRGKKKRRSTY